MIEAIAILTVPLVIATALLHRVHGRRYSGRTYDPTRPVIQRAGAQRVGFTGRMCDFCGVATFGWSDRCGKCHRLPVRLPPIAPASSLASEVPSSGASVTTSTKPRHDPTTAPAKLPSPSSSEAAPDPALRGTRRTRSRSAS